MTSFRGHTPEESIEFLDHLLAEKGKAQEALRAACTRLLQEGSACCGSEPVRSCTEDMSQSPACQLRIALCAAWDAGFDDRDDLVATGEKLIHDWEARVQKVWADLRHAIYDARAVPSFLTDITWLSDIKLRLSSTLTRAMEVHWRERHLHESELILAQQQRGRIHNMIEDAKGQIRVYCRIRPLSASEQRRGDHNVLQIIDDMSLSLPNGSTFACDGIYAPANQEKIFEDCRDLVQSAADGRNVTIFSYGNTGTGKTFTMYGNSSDDGIAQRTVREVFKVARGLGEHHSVTVSASMLELYNDGLIDLLPQNGETRKLRIRQEGSGIVRVDGLQEHVANTAEEMLRIFQTGKQQRIISGNTMNTESSRSHVIFTLKIETLSHCTQEVRCGKIVLCDLGGSEQLKKTEVSGRQMKEAIELNKSLTALGDVIHAVAAKHNSIPYRNHKLTQLLQDSIGGSAKTLMFVSCSPAASDLSQTTMSLNYAARAKAITNAGLPMISPTASCRTLSS